MEEESTSDHPFGSSTSIYTDFNRGHNPSQTPTESSQPSRPSNSQVNGTVTKNSLFSTGNQSQLQTDYFGNQLSCNFDFFDSHDKASQKQYQESEYLENNNVTPLKKKNGRLSDQMHSGSNSSSGRTPLLDISDQKSKKKTVYPELKLNKALMFGNTPEKSLALEEKSNSMKLFR